METYGKVFLNFYSFLSAALTATRSVFMGLELCDNFKQRAFDAWLYTHFFGFSNAILYFILCPVISVSVHIDNKTFSRIVFVVPKNGCAQ